MNQGAQPPELEILVFEVGGQRYGLPASDVREIVRAVTIVSLPKAPAIVEGVINLRGRIVPVLDVRSRFRLPPKPAEHTDHLVIAQAGERLVALRVDCAVELVRVDRASLADVCGAVPNAEYVSWVAKLPANLVLIHDLRTFLSRAEAESLDSLDLASAETPARAARREAP